MNPAAPLAAASEAQSAPTAADVRAALRPSGQLTLVGREQLYDRPDTNAGTGAFLSPQTVVPLGFSAETGFYLISTWIGDKWIRPSHGVLEGIEPYEKEVVPDAPVYLFDAPLIGSNSGQTKSGVLQAFEKWRTWYHIRTEAGDKWVNLAYALPERLRPSEEPVALPDGATLFQYPYGLSGAVATIGPQTVVPVEHGDEWYHLRGDYGDGWVYIHMDDNERQSADDGVPVKRTKAIELARQRLGLSADYALDAARLVQLGDGEKRWNIAFMKKQGDSIAGSGEITLSAADGSVDWFTKSGAVSVPGLADKAQDAAAFKQLAERFAAETSPVPDAKWTLDETPPSPLEKRHITMGAPARFFRFVRTVNGLPYPENYISITVNPIRNEISYSLLWSDNKRFDAPEGLKTKDEAESAFAGAFLTKAVFMAPYASREKMPPVYAVAPRLYDTIDAIDGHWNESDGGMKVRGPVTAQPLAAMPTENLNVTLDQAADSGRRKLGLPENAAVENARQGIHSWLFQLNVPAPAAAQSKLYFLEVSTVTGDIVQYASDLTANTAWLTVPGVSEDQARAAAEQALRQMLPAYTHQLYEIRSDLRLTEGNMIANPEYQFTYRRRIDGIWGDRQDVTVSVSAASGKLLAVQNQMITGIYPASRPAFISEDEVLKLMLSRYRVEAYYASDSLLLTNPSTSIRYRLVPTTESAYTSLLDVQTGIWRQFSTLEPEKAGKSELPNSQ
ncbi:hypothetical protein SD70_16560 [Gordoniibacillus kamchatkensis]|uniref:YcdB/YcdC repeated domain-containing protein n=1 Tax=Gordoniibacillus kamchatkensis TaxID=1590651 RepID=A0ABR5AG11_9BACL|nr:hypothetical protein SD70_16560 [Paenibacillus sp. VKM B-2647]